MLGFCPLQKISTYRLYSFAHAGCFFLVSSRSSHQLAISGHIMGSKRPEKTEDCGTVKVPPAEDSWLGREHIAGLI